ncbi:DUF1761 domain-containing protein [Candidatus Woesearchaeota archaeon]|nr:DUF1761 domain-containing protein [Candidatus Woesearchaeota archaeon]
MLVALNYYGVGGAALASIILGMIWFSPKVFGESWMRAAGLSKAFLKRRKEEGMGASYFWMFVSSVVGAYVLGYFLVILNVGNLVSALFAGLLLWLGFNATVTIGVVLWEGKPWKLWFLNNVFNLLSLLVMSVILFYFG